MTDSEIDWERVQDDRDRETLRLPVPGGWLYSVTEKGDMGAILHQNVVFVRDPEEDLVVFLTYPEDDMLDVVVHKPHGEG